MAAFTKKAITRSKTLGERLKKVREEAGISLDAAADKTQVRKQYLEALERGTYADLPGPVYIENFLKRYAEFLGVSPDFVIDVYKHQDQKSLKKEYKQRWPLSHVPPREVITPRVLKLVGIGLLILVGLGYVGFEVMKIFSPPALTVVTPTDYLTVTAVSLPVAGSTDPDATLTVNDKQIFLDEKGNFSETISLQEGLNVITISAEKKRSKATVVTRRILLRSDQPQLQTEL
ncbi:MAG: helix-turn-helix domain-containing protein [Patescibacteria group bacterium]